MSLSPSRLRTRATRTGIALLFTLLLASVAARPAFADETKDVKSVTHPAALEKAVPESIDDLKVIQKQVKTVLEKVMPCIVGLQVTPKTGQPWQGSGVIVREDGYILTAGHVVGEEGNEVSVIMPDGKKLKGKTLGANNGIDSGLIKITPEGKYPFCEMGNSKAVKNGDWCVCIGHPGGYKEGRSPVVRVGRILVHNDSLLQSDCTMVGGDSGGPLFDIDGKVIGINSRIGPTIQSNIHVPVDTFRDDWVRLAKGEVWGGVRFGNPNRPYLGFSTSSNSNDTKIAEIDPDSPAAKAGLKVGDVILKFDGKTVANYDELRAMTREKKIGDEVVIVVMRAKETLEFKLTLARRPRNGN